MLVGVLIDRTNLSVNKIYIDKLIEAQQDIFGDIEQMYFNSMFSSLSTTSYFSEERFLQLITQKQIKELEEEIDSELEEDFDSEIETNNIEY